MSIVPELAAMDGVIAAGEYSYRGDRFTCEGDMTDDMARMASIMCRSTSLAVHMQMDMIKNLGHDCGSIPSQGWIVNGDNFSVCVVANHFCFLQNDAVSLNEIVSYMRENVPDQDGQLV